MTRGKNGQFYSMRPVFVEILTRQTKFSHCIVWTSEDTHPHTQCTCPSFISYLAERLADRLNLIDWQHGSQSLKPPLWPRCASFWPLWFHLSLWIPWLVICCLVSQSWKVVSRWTCANLITHTKGFCVSVWMLIWCSQTCEVSLMNTLTYRWLNLFSPVTGSHQD